MFLEFLDPHAIKFILAFSLISFLVIFAMGLSKKVVIYNDYGDFFCTIGFIVSPLLFVILIQIFLPEAKGTNWEFVWNNSLGKAIIITVALFAATALFYNFKNSIESNGYIVGVIVGVFKIIAGLFASLFFLGFLGRANDKSKSNDRMSVLLLMLLFGLLGLVLKNLINGEAVLKNRSSATSRSTLFILLMIGTIFFSNYLATTDNQNINSIFQELGIENKKPTSKNNNTDLQKDLNKSKNSTQKAPDKEQSQSIDKDKAFISKVQEILSERWNKTINTQHGNKATVKIEINEKGTFSYQIVELSGDNVFNAKLKDFLNSTKKVPFPKYEKGPLFEMTVDFQDV